MKHFLFTLFFICGVVLTITHPAYAATMTFEAPDVASTNGQPIAVRVFVDPEGTPLSALSGEFSFSDDLFTVGDITTQSSIVSIWITHPAVSSEKYFDTRTHVTFEGIMPGGFSGVRSPYYDGVHSGVVFTITLIPKKQGSTTLLLDNIELHAFDQSGTKINTERFSKKISVPALTTVHEEKIKEPSLTISPTLSVSLAHDPLIEHNAWYVTVNEDESIRPINHIEIVETNDYSPEYVSSYTWRTMKNPYVLLFQSRNKYIHVKVMYEDGSYATQTVPPVENSQTNSYLSRILGGIVIALFILYRYGKNLLHIFKPTHH